MTSQYPFVLPPLPFPYDALEPEIDAKTMHFHHDKHFATYVDNLNHLLSDYPAYQSWPLEQLCTNWADLPDEIRQGVRNNAGGVYNHDLYFQMLQALPASEPDGPLLAAIDRAFGDLEGLKTAMKNAALRVFGSGWVWLAANGQGGLSLLITSNQDTPLPMFPLLCCDVWEHAYYLQYQNRRAEYFDAWWRLINWPAVSARYDWRFGQQPLLSRS